MHARAKAVSASALALVLGLGGALSGAMPASAALSDVDTPGWTWEQVDDDTATINDAFSQFTDFAGTTIDPEGWTSDAFDGFPDVFELTFGADTESPTFSGVSTTTVGGLTTIVTTATADFGGGNIVDILAILELQGSYARWTYAFDDGGLAILPAVSVHLKGELGSDTDSLYTSVGSTGLISGDGGMSDPVIGYDFASTSTWAYDVTNGDPQFMLDFLADTTSTLTVALIEWDPCSYPAAVGTMIGLIPTLAATFGGTIAPQYTTNCLQVAAPGPVIGVTDQLLALSESPFLDAWNYYDDNDAANYLRSTPISLPAGLSAVLVFDGVTGAPSLHLTGSAATGSYTATILFYEEGNPGEFFIPTLATFALTVTGLAATGVEVTPWLISAALFSILGVALVAGASARRRFALGK